MWLLPREPYNEHIPFTQEEIMSPITPEQQSSLNEDFNKLNGKEKAELLLASVIGKQLRGEWLEVIKTAMTNYMIWHEKQHPNFKSCEYCEFINDNITMFRIMKHWVEQYDKATNQK